MPAYVKISGTLRETDKLYDKVGGTLKATDKGYDKVAGTLREYYSNTVPLSNLAAGSRVLYNGVYYTVIAGNYCVSGDVILWSETSTTKCASGSSENTTSSTPFGTTNTNKVKITYSQDNDDGTNVEDIRSNYGWTIPAKALGAHISIGSPKMSYFSSDTQRIRSTEYGCCDYTSLGAEASNYKSYYVNISGTIKTSSRRPIKQAYYAYSVKGTLACVQNSDGTYTLQI